MESQRVERTLNYQENGLAPSGHEVNASEARECAEGAEHLRAYGKDEARSNCGRHNDCVGAVSMLDLFRALKSCPTFEIETFSPEKLAGVYLRNENDDAVFRDIEEAALSVGNREISAAVQTALANSTQKRGNLMGPGLFFSRAAKFAEGRPIIRRYAASLRRVAGMA